MNEDITIVDQLAVPGGKIFIGGFIKPGTEKPTENIAVGSWLFDTGTKEISFFNGTSWG